MEKLKSIGEALLGIGIFIGIVVALFLLFRFGAEVAFAIAPFINWLAGILLVINVISLLFLFVPKARAWVGLVLFISSFVYGVSAWIFGLAVTLSLWGWIAVIIGLIFGGIGVVPIGLLAALFNGEWGIFWSLLFSVVLAYGSRMIGYLLVDTNADNSARGDIIDIEPEDDDQYHQEIGDRPALQVGKTRNWSDLE